LFPTSLIDKYFKKNVLFVTRSNWNPDAVNSGSGAAGIMQFMERTAEGRGMTVNFFRDDRKNPAMLSVERKV
jgi:hypothetical protein